MPSKILYFYYKQDVPGIQTEKFSTAVSCAYPLAECRLPDKATNTKIHIKIRGNDGYLIE